MPASPPRRRRTAGRFPRFALLVTALLLAALLPAAAASAAPAPSVPQTVLQPLGAQAPVAVVPYKELVGAANAGRLNTAVVDTATYWVAATDRAGHVVGAEIPRPKAGDFASAPSTGSSKSLPSALDLAARLRADGVTVLAPVAAAGGSGLLGVLFLPVGLVLFLAIGIAAVAISRRRNPSAGGGMARPGEHGRIRRNSRVESPAVRFADIAGCDEAVEELREIVTFLRHPDRFARVGARMPRGVILYGPPGTGKTLLAKAVAGESDVPFFAMSGSDFVDTYVGVGASRVRDLFAQARQSKTGAIIFFDEFDAVGRARGGGTTGADSEREGTLNQLLVELDGFGKRDRIVVIGATNRIDMLDKAVLRPGRFDRRVQVGLPAEKGRLEILRLHSRGMPVADPASLEGLARVTAGFAGADLANMVNEAAIMAARAERDEILAEDFDEGMLRAVAGPQRAERRMAEGELEMIAWHEAGHALAAELCPSHQKAQRVTILSRGDAGGLALYGASDHALTSQQHLHERMVVAMAGRAAEQIRFAQISSGAANDLEMVNNMARMAVERLGFSTRVGQIVAAAGIQEMPLSDQTRRVIDEEIDHMVDAAYADAIALLSAHRVELDVLARNLLEHEQLDRSQITLILASIAKGGRRRPSQVGRLPTDRRRSAHREHHAPLPEPTRVIDLPQRVNDDDAAEPRRRRLAGVAGDGRRAAEPRRQRTLARVEAAAAVLYAITLPRVRSRRSRRKRPRIA